MVVVQLSEWTQHSVFIEAPLCNLEHVTIAFPNLSFSILLRYSFTYFIYTLPSSQQGFKLGKRPQLYALPRDLQNLETGPDKYNCFVLGLCRFRNWGGRWMRGRSYRYSVYWFNSILEGPAKIIAGLDKGLFSLANKLRGGNEVESAMFSLEG